MGPPGTQRRRACGAEGCGSWRGVSEAEFGAAGVRRRADRGPGQRVAAAGRRGVGGSGVAGVVAGTQLGGSGVVVAERLVAEDGAAPVGRAAVGRARARRARGCCLASGVPRAPGRLQPARSRVITRPWRRSALLSVGRREGVRMGFALANAILLTPVTADFNPEDYQRFLRQIELVPCGRVD